MTDIMFTRTALTEAAEKAGVTIDQARAILEAAGVELAPEPSGPGMYRTRVGDILIVGTAKTEYPDALWLCGEGGSGKVYMINAEDLRSGSYPLTPARIAPVAAAPAEGEPIDVDDVRKGDLVRVELDNGDEATFTVRTVDHAFLYTKHNAFHHHTIRSVRLLHREEA